MIKICPSLEFEHINMKNGLTLYKIEARLRIYLSLLFYTVVAFYLSVNTVNSLPVQNIIDEFIIYIIFLTSLQNILPR